MPIVKGMSALLCAVVLAMPMAASADRDRDRDYDRYEDECEDRRGNGRCRDGNGRGNGRGNGHRGRGGDHHAGGPPPWAPAHGWRRKHGGGYDRDHGGYDDDDYYVEERSGARVHVSNGNASIDVGIRDGHCNREQIGTVVGGLIGGAIGNRVGGSDNREVATVLGVVVGGVLGNRVGRSMDNNDRHCTGQTLEQAPDHHTVRWADDRNGEYRVTPQRTYEADGRFCRDYITEYDGRNGVEREESSACRNEDGSWQRRRTM